MDKTPQPIIVIGAPRSRTSMTAGLFALHGAWCGTCRRPDKFNAKGYFENQQFKTAIINRVGAIVQRGSLAPEVDGWKKEALQIIKHDGYQGGPWMVKHSAMYYPLWHEFNPVFINVRRDPDSVMKSGKKTKYFVNDAAMEPHIKAMDYVRDNLGGIDVWSGKILDGDYSEIDFALKAAGFEPDHAIIEAFVDKKLDHFGG